MVVTTPTVPSRTPSRKATRSTPGTTRANSSRSAAQADSGITITAGSDVVGRVQGLRDAGEGGGDRVRPMPPPLGVVGGVAAEVVVERVREADQLADGLDRVRAGRGWGSSGPALGRRTGGIDR